MDSIAPSRRPEGPNAGTQSWNQLLFMHWTLPVESVRALVPPSLELDLYQGEAYVGLVAFKMEKVRASFVPELLAMNFLETNLRTYVYANGVPGIYVLSADAASRLAVAAARLAFSLPYYFAEMNLAENDGNFVYDSVREENGIGAHVIYRVGDVMERRELEPFLVDRYVLFSEREGRLRRTRVHHTPYPLRSAEVLGLEETLMSAVGLAVPLGPPRHVCFSDGVDVEMFSPEDA